MDTVGAPRPFYAGAVAVAATIAVTSALRCLHPPAGAVALTAVTGGSTIAHAGYGFAFVPVALDSLLLVGAGSCSTSSGAAVHRLSEHSK